MPTIVRGEKVLVSGASGFIGMWVVRDLLEAGYAVRGAVRSASKAAFVEAYFADLGYGDRVETVVVEDIAVADVFDEAVKGVDAIVHIASPITLNVKNAQDFIKPAVQGTVGILASALKYGTRVKRVVVTGSCTAIATPSTEPATFSETDWDSGLTQRVKEMGEKASLTDGYRASKSLAETAAWDFIEQHKSDITWDLAVISPPFVVGPPIQEATSLATLNLSVKHWVSVLTSTKPMSKEALLYSESWIDVRDVARAHVRALERREAGGERIVVAAGTFNWQEWIEAAGSLPHTPLKSHDLYKGDPSILDGTQQYLVSYDTAKAARILGITYRTKQETVADALENMRARGW